MAKETPSPEQQPSPVSTAQQPLAIKKLLMIGVPVFLVQLALLFFVATKFVGGGTPAPKYSGAAVEAEAKAGGSGEGGEAAGGHMFVVKDLIVNPAGTNGTRFLLLTIGFETSTPEGLKDLEQKEIQVRDALNSVLTTKGLDELASVERREELRGEIQTKVGALLKSGAISSVYFSKFIIQ